MWLVFQQTGHPSTPSWRDQQHLNQDQAQSSDVPCHHQQTPTKKISELQPTRRFYLTIPRPEPCIDSIGSPFGQRRRPETVYKTTTTLHSMRWQRPPLQRWFNGSLENRPPPSRSTCCLVLSYDIWKPVNYVTTIPARTTPDVLMFHTSSEQKKTWRNF